MSGLSRFLDVCEMCNGRELEFIFFDLLVTKKEGGLIRDIPGFRCRDCHGILLSSGVIEVIDEMKHSGHQDFPVTKYQEKILNLSSEDKKLSERYLHAWDLVRLDERCYLETLGYRVLGEWKQIANL
ncbi:MAG: hypothetical protein CL676_03625 [Bdellovibrionaceae bacterium]|nr:hypothetical protein [Pseudobdellovibrionaceae bacterium]